MRWFPIAAMWVALMACATAPVARNFENLADYPGSTFSEVWDLVIDVFGDRNWAIDNLERDSGIIATDWMRDDNVSYQDCGSPGLLSVDSNHMGRFNVVVRETDDGVSIRVTTSWQATRSFDNIGNIVECLSTGILERELHEEVQERLEGEW